MTDSCWENWSCPTLWWNTSNWPWDQGQQRHPLPPSTPKFYECCPPSSPPGIPKRSTPSSGNYHHTSQPVGILGQPLYPVPMAHPPDNGAAQSPPHTLNHPSPSFSYPVAHHPLTMFHSASCGQNNHRQCLFKSKKKNFGRRWTCRWQCPGTSSEPSKAP